MEEKVITLSSQLTESDLNQILIKLLESEKQSETEEDFSNLHFDFLINQEFLRGTIKSHLLKHDIFSEETIQIWYTFSLSAPKQGKQNQEEDWVSDLALLNPFSLKQSPIIASLYNGQISVYNSNLTNVFHHQICDTSIKSVAVQLNYLANNSKQYLVYSACNDEKVRLGVLNYVKNDIQYKELADLTGSQSSFECLDINILQNTFLCACTYTGELLIYNLTQKSLSDAPQNSEEKQNNKKLKLNKKQITPLTTVKLHNDNISSVFWKDSDKILTSSYDHHIKLYDTTKQTEINDVTLKDSAATAMLPMQNNTVLIGHEDKSIKQWDLREKNTSKLFKSHTGWISDIQLLENNVNVFLSTSYDHSIKVWDLRSTFPLFTIKTHHDKVLCGLWNGENTCVSGGSDNQVVSHLFQ